MNSDFYSDDLDSVTNDLRDSAKGSNDGYDVAFSLTDDIAILAQSALCMPSVLVNNVYCADVSCEWVSCVQFPSIFLHSFHETEITTIS